MKGGGWSQPLLAFHKSLRIPLNDCEGAHHWAESHLSLPSNCILFNSQYTELCTPVLTGCNVLAIFFPLSLILLFKYMCEIHLNFLRLSWAGHYKSVGSKCANLLSQVFHRHHCHSPLISNLGCSGPAAASWVMNGSDDRMWEFSWSFFSAFAFATENLNASSKRCKNKVSPSPSWIHSLHE